MTVTTPSVLAGDAIAGLLRRGILLSDDVIHFIDSTFLNPSAAAVEQLLDDPAACEADSLAELIFFPDLAMQTALEPVLEDTVYTPDDVDTVIHQVLKTIRTVTVTFPHGRGGFSVALTRDIVQQLVHRLNLCRQIDPRLSAAVSRVISDPSERYRLRVRLRNLRQPLTPAACDFLCTAIEKMYGQSPFFDAASVLLLAFFEQNAPEKNIYDGLMREKKAILKAIARWEKNQTALAGQNVEMLMLRGVSIQAIDSAAAWRNVTLIDHICLTLFGKTETMGFEPAREMTVAFE